MGEIIHEYKWVYLNYLHNNCFLWCRVHWLRNCCTYMNSCLHCGNCSDRHSDICRQISRSCNLFDYRSKEVQQRQSMHRCVELCLAHQKVSQSVFSNTENGTINSTAYLKNSKINKTSPQLRLQPRPPLCTIRWVQTSLEPPPSPSQPMVLS